MCPIQVEVTEHHERLLRHAIADLWYRKVFSVDHEEKAFYREIFPDVDETKFRKIVVYANSAPKDNDLLERMGFVYIMLNESLPGLIKIGYSVDPHDRARQLQRTYSLNKPFWIYKAWMTYLAPIVETLVHRDLSRFRVSKPEIEKMNPYMNFGDEFFRLEKEKAEEAIIQYVDSRLVLGT